MNWSLLSIDEKVECALLIREGQLGRKHGHARAKFDEQGVVDTLAHYVKTGLRRPGLLAMAKAGELAHCFEQIVIEHAALFDPEVVARANGNLVRARAQLASPAV